MTEAELTEVLEALLALDSGPPPSTAAPAAVAALKNLTSELIGRFCSAAQRGHPIASGRRRAAVTRYAADLVVPRRQRLECALLKAVTAHYVMNRAGVARRRPGSAS